MLNEMRPYLLKGKVEQDFTAAYTGVCGDLGNSPFRFDT